MAMSAYRAHDDVFEDRTAELGQSEKRDLPYEDVGPNNASGPFGSEEFAEVKYRTMSWWQAGMLMVAETISLGILSLPSVMARLGLAPTIVLIVGLGLLATYTGYVLGQFKLRHPHVHSMADAGEILMGRIGREVLGNGQLLFLIFILGSHLLTWNIMMNHITEHAICTIIYGVCGMILSIILSLPRTMKKVSWMSVASFISIFSAMMITMVAIAVQHPNDGGIDITVKQNLHDGFLAVTSIVFSYAGHVAFFGFISEMEIPTDYPKTLIMLQGTDTTLYTVAAIVIYVYGGKNVESPALGSTSPLVSKIAYGIAIPTIVIAGVINGHVAAKYIYVRIFRNTNHMGKRSFLSIGSWVGIVISIWVIGWIIAEAIPVFNNLLSLIVSLFASWFTYGLSGVFWLYMNKGKWFSSPTKIFLTLVNLIIFGIGLVLCAMGLWVSGTAIHNNTDGTSFAC